MRLSYTLFTSLALTLSALAATMPTKRQGVIVTVPGTTVAPSDGSEISPESSFTFSYERRNYCESGYSPISVYLSTSQPTNADVTGDGELADGSFVFKFGDYLYPNFGMLLLSHRLSTHIEHQRAQVFPRWALLRRPL